ncbi:MAG TPA: protein kinase [Terriglobales bacterium]|nr:protein kinase [Terriglobales bacterium]
MAGPTVTKIGKYDVIEVLGKGGMGVVYKAMDNRIGRLVAIKMMTGGFADNPDLLKRFYREAQATGMLEHPNIVIVYELGDQDGNPYMVMQYLEGEPLDKMIQQRREISMVEKLGYIIQACNGLNYAHQRGLVHRDIKPANLMVLKDGTCKLVDFGIARLGDTSLTRTGQVVGTIHYMSPEQINAQVVDGRTDIWSTGVMLFELLTYTLPFEGNDMASTLLKIIHEQPPSLSKFLNNYPPDLDEVIQRALAKDREERYATAEDFAFDLGRAQEQLKKQVVSEYVDRARGFMERQELQKAKELLQQVLRVDTAHTVAKELMHEVQQRISKQVRGEQIRQLRSNAEDAMAHKMYDDALAYVEQALSMDKTNTELLNLRDIVKAAKEKKDKAVAALRKAESAQQVGDLDVALKAAEEAVGIDPENTQARTLHASLAREVAEHSKQRDMQKLLDEARRDITGRKYTAAFDVLKKAEEIDPASPELHNLMNLASSGRDQESKRRELEKLSNEIEDALARDDYKVACVKADEALQKYPSEPAFLKLKALADKQREAGEKKKFAEEQIVKARKLLDTGKATEALALLESAQQRAPGDARLQSLLAIVRESAEREKAERTKDEFLSKAKECLRKKDYDGAVMVLEMAQAQIEGSAEINDLLQFARDEAAQQARRAKTETALKEVQRLMAEEEYDRAVVLLESTLKEAPDDELKVLLEDAKRHKDEAAKKVQVAITKAQRLLEARKVDDAVTFLEGLPKSFAKSAEFTNLLEKARSEQDMVRAVGGAVQQAKAAIEKGDFASAINIVEACKKTYGETPDIKAALADIESKKVSMARQVVEKAVRDARTLLLSRQYQAALRSLHGAGPLVAAAPPELQQQYNALKTDAEKGASRIQKEQDLKGTIVAGSLDMSKTMVAGSVEAPTAAAPAPVSGVQRRVVVAPPPPKKAPVMLIVIAAVILAVIGGGVFAFRDRIWPPQRDAYVEINAVPWGTVTSARQLNGRFHEDYKKDNQTPLRLALPAGEYEITIAGPTGQEKTEKVKISPQSTGSITPVFEQLDVEKIVNAK